MVCQIMPIKIKGRHNDTWSLHWKYSCSGGLSRIKRPLKGLGTLAVDVQEELRVKNKRVEPT